MRRPRGDATGDPSGQGRSGASKTIDASANATTRNRFDQPKIAAALAAFAKFKARTYGVAFYFLPIRTSVGRCDGSEIDFRESRACFVCLFVCLFCGRFSCRDSLGARIPQLFLNETTMAPSRHCLNTTNGCQGINRRKAFISRINIDQY